MKKVYDCEDGCPAQTTLQFISGKWKSIILYHIFKNNVLRFSEIPKKMPYVTKRMLARQLAELEEDGIIDKKIYPVIPVKTEYRMTNLGQTLSPVINAMADWGTTYADQVDYK